MKTKLVLSIIFMVLLTSFVFATPLGDLIIQRYIDEGYSEEEAQGMANGTYKDLSDLPPPPTNQTIQQVQTQEVTSILIIILFAAVPFIGILIFVFCIWRWVR